LLLDEGGEYRSDPGIWRRGSHSAATTGSSSRRSGSPIAQIDHRYGRPARDAILAAATAQLFLPPLADPTTTGYLNGVLGEEPVAQQSRQRGGGPGTLSVAHRPVASAPWLRQIARGRALLIYRDLAPAAVRAPGWFEDPRFAGQPRLPPVPMRQRAGREIRWPHPASWGHKQ